MHMVRKKYKFERTYSGRCAFGLNQSFPTQREPLVPFSIYFSRDTPCLHKHKWVSCVNTCVNLHSSDFTPYLLFCISPHILYLTTVPSGILIHINLFWKFLGITMYGCTYSTMIWSSLSILFKRTSSYFRSSLKKKKKFV